LERYIAARGISGFEGIDWESQPKAILRNLQKAIAALPSPERETVFDDLERVDQLCNEVGQTALREAVASTPALISRIRSCEGDEARGLLVLLYDPAALDRALATAFASRHRFGRSWSGFSGPALVEPTEDRIALRALEARIGALFNAFDGSGRKLKVDRFERRGRSSVRAAEARIIHYAIYIEGLPETGMEFERDELKRQVRRPAIEAAICYCPDTGDLDIVSKGGRKLREDIAHAYASNLLGSDERLETLQRRRFNLDRLKNPMPFPSDPADGIKEAKTTLLRIADFSHQLGRLTMELGDAGHRDIHSVSARWFGAADPLKQSHWRVTQARLRITFHPEASGKREKTISIDLRAPNGSNLRDQTRRHQLVAEKYLERWGLIARG
jgi:hypothetical protein